MTKKRERAGFYARLIASYEERFKQKPTQTELGKLAGVRQGAVAKWVSGGLPTLDKAIVMAGKLGVCVEWLLTQRGPKHPGATLAPDQQALLDLYTEDQPFRRLVHHWHILQPEGRMFVLRTARLEHATQHTGDEARREEFENNLAIVTDAERRKAAQK